MFQVIATNDKGHKTIIHSATRSIDYANALKNAAKAFYASVEVKSVR